MALQRWVGLCASPCRAWVVSIQFCGFLKKLIVLFLCPERRAVHALFSQKIGFCFPNKLCKWKCYKIVLCATSSCYFLCSELKSLRFSGGRSVVKMDCAEQRNMGTEWRKGHKISRPRPQTHTAGQSARVVQHNCSAKWIVQSKQGYNWCALPQHLGCCLAVGKEIPPQAFNLRLPKNYCQKKCLCSLLLVGVDERLAGGIKKCVSLLPNPSNEWQYAFLILSLDCFMWTLKKMHSLTHLLYAACG